MKIPKVVSTKIVLDAIKKVSEKAPNVNKSFQTSFTQVDPVDLMDEDTQTNVATQSMMLDTSQMTDFDKSPSVHSEGEIDKPELMIQNLTEFNVKISGNRRKDILSMEKLDELDLSICDNSYIKPKLNLQKQDEINVRPLVLRNKEKRTEKTDIDECEKIKHNFGWRESLKLGAVGVLILTKKVMFRKYFSTF